MTEFLEFDERNTDSIDAQERPWHLLIVDDDPEPVPEIRTVG